MFKGSEGHSRWAGHPCPSLDRANRTLRQDSAPWPGGPVTSAPGAEKGDGSRCERREASCEQPDGWPTVLMVSHLVSNTSVILGCSIVFNQKREPWKPQTDPTMPRVISVCWLREKLAKGPGTRPSSCLLRSPVAMGSRVFGKSEPQVPFPGAKESISLSQPHLQGAGRFDVLPFLARLPARQ